MGEHVRRGPRLGDWSAPGDDDATRLAERLAEPIEMHHVKQRPVGGGKQAAYVGSDVLV